MLPGVNSSFSETSEHWLVDLYDLNSYAFNISKVSHSVPELRGDHTTLPQRSGVIPRLNRSYEAGEIALNMWVLGAELDGSVPPLRSERRALFERNLEALLTLFHHQSGPINLYKMSVAPGSSGSAETRYARALITGSTSLETMAARQRAEMVVTFKLIDSHWSALNPVTETTAASSDLPKNLTLTNMSSAPVEDAVITITGPVATPTIACPDSGTSVKYNGNIATGQTLVLDCGTWTAMLGSTNVTSAITNSGHARWLYIPPRGSAAINVAASLKPTITMTGAGAAASTKFSVTYRKRYLLP